MSYIKFTFIKENSNDLDSYLYKKGVGVGAKDVERNTYFL